MMKHDNSRVLILLEEVIYLKEEGFGGFGWSVHLDGRDYFVQTKWMAVGSRVGTMG